MPSRHSHTFSLEVEGWSPDDLVVTSFSGSESLSRPFDFQVEFAPLDGKPIEWAELLTKPAALQIRVADGEPRYVHGYVHEAESLEPIDRWPRYRVRLVPDLLRLGHVHRSRIFQDQSTQEIVKKVLDDAGIEHRWSLTGSYGPREYCLQYRETDLDFISRLLEWEGIFYSFEHSQEGHVLVLSDDAASATDTPAGADLPLHEDRGMVAEEEHFTHFQQVRRVRPGAVVTRDFDFKNPVLDLTATAQVENGPPELELYDYPEGYGAPADGKRVSAVRLEERQQGRHTHAGESTCPRLSPGYTLQMQEPAPEGMAGKYLAVEVRHRGERRVALHPQVSFEDARYHNELRCLSHGSSYRPRRRTRWPVLAGIQTATVVGPPGEEIHPDKHGRIKVQFHWDRDGKQDDHSSCFIRVGQTWGGPAWGAVFLPRVGQEVVVRFLEGNPDRPLITGAVYNGANLPPATLPSEKTQSTLKSSSSLGGDGFNEVRFEDAAGEEEIFIHAQKDEQLVTENDKAQEIRRFETRLVKKDRRSTVKGNQSLEVMLDDAGQVQQNQTLQVMGNRETAVTGNHAETVEGQQDITVAKDQEVRIALAASTAVGGAATLQVGGALTVSVALAAQTTAGGALTRSVGSDSSEEVAGAREEMVMKDLSLKVDADSEVESGGQVSLNVGKDLAIQVNGKVQYETEHETAWPAKTLELKADKLSFVVNGKRILSLEKSGDVTLAATTVSLDGSRLRLAGSNVKKEQPSSSSSQLEEEVGLRKRPFYLRLHIDPERAKEHHGRFRLFGTNGSYEQTKSIADDLIKGDEFVDLMFTGVPTRLSYSLEMLEEGAEPLLLIENVPFARLNAYQPEATESEREYSEDDLFALEPGYDGSDVPA